MTPGLSVVIPALNEERVLAGTLRQFDSSGTVLPLETVVSDDGSADETCAIARELADRLVCNPGAPPGRSGALNRGAAAARYDCLLFLDADLRLEPLAAFLEEVRAAFIADPDVVGGMIDFRVRPEEETPADRITHAWWNGVMRGTLALTGIGISTPGFQMAKREAFRRIGGFDESLRLTQDVDYSLRLSREGSIHYFRQARLLETPRRYRDEGYFVYAWRSSLRWGSILLRRKSHGVYRCVR
jgi:glycosyltransferase involved in cell wall biosynthesis